MKTQISIIGFGNFGQLMARHLIKVGASVFVNDISDKTQEAGEIGARIASLEETCKSKIIILAMPMEKLEQTLHKIKDKLQEGTLVLDVCSLKMFVCGAMNRILPSNVEIIGTHPLFGPQSAPNSIAGMRIALVNVRAKQETFEKVKNFCENLDLKVIITTPEEHDKQMAVSQALTHFIGQAVKITNIQRVVLSTKTFDDLMNIVDIIKKDTPALFNNMHKMNPFTREARDNFVNSVNELNNQLNSNSGRKTKCQNIV